MSVQLAKQLLDTLAGQTLSNQRAVELVDILLEAVEFPDGPPQTNDEKAQAFFDVVKQLLRQQMARGATRRYEKQNQEAIKNAVQASISELL